MSQAYLRHSCPQLLSLQLAIGLLLSSTAIVGYTVPGTLANSPLFLIQNSTPNIFFEVDDSGSMDWEILAKTHWEPCAYDRNYPAKTGDDDCDADVSTLTNANSGKFGLIGTMRSYPTDDAINNQYPLYYSEYTYIYDNDDNIYNLYGRGCTGTFYDSFGYGYTQIPSLESCPAAIRDYEWRMRLSALNVLYYNPMTVYLPWKNGDGTSMPSADFTQARSNPISTQPGYSLQRDLTGFVYEEWIDSHGFSGPRPRRGNNINRTTGANGQVDFWDEHTRYTINANDITVENTKYTVDSSGRLNNDVTTSTVTSLLDANGAIITLMQIKQNIANWYQYHRRRSFVAKAAIAEVIDNNPNYRYGLNVINDPIMFTPVPDTVKPPFDTHNTNLT